MEEREKKLLTDFEEREKISVEELSQSVIGKYYLHYLLLRTFRSVIFLL